MSEAGSYFGGASAFSFGGPHAQQDTDGGFGRSTVGSEAGFGGNSAQSLVFAGPGRFDWVEEGEADHAEPGALQRDESAACGLEDVLRKTLSAAAVAPRRRARRRAAPSAPEGDEQAEGEAAAPAAKRPRRRGKAAAQPAPAAAPAAAAAADAAAEPAAADAVTAGAAADAAAAGSPAGAADGGAADPAADSGASAGDVELELELQGLQDFRVSSDDDEQHRRRPGATRRRWTPQDEERLYEGIRQFGMQLGMIATFFPQRTLKELRAKLRIEQQRRPQRLERAMKARKPIDHQWVEHASALGACAREMKQQEEDRQRNRSESVPDPLEQLIPPEGQGGGDTAMRSTLAGLLEAPAAADFMQELRAAAEQETRGAGASSVPGGGSEDDEDGERGDGFDPAGRPGGPKRGGAWSDIGIPAASTAWSDFGGPQGSAAWSDVGGASEAGGGYGARSDFGASDY